MAQEKISIPISYPSGVEGAVEKVRSRTDSGELLEEAISHCIYDEAISMSETWKIDYTIIHEENPSIYRIIEEIGVVLPFYYRLTDTLLNVLHPKSEPIPEAETEEIPSAGIPDIDNGELLTLDLQTEAESITLSAYYRTHSPLEFIDFVAKLEVQKIDILPLPDNFKNRQKEVLEKGRLRFHEFNQAAKEAGL